MRSEGAANRWSLNSRGGGSVTGVWEHAENSRHNPSTAGYFTGQMMRPAVSAVKQLPRVVVQHHGGRVSESRGSVAPIERIGSRILLVRGHKVLLDADLAALYGVETRGLHHAKLQQNFFTHPHFVMSNPGARMGLRRAPFAFTEHGALMAATVLNSPRAVETSVYVVRAFIRLRQFLATHKDLARRLEEHEKKRG
ncbi:MAG: ORF6N domain-containing protein [Betaproteobacteria bacterium]|nr:MAG: ORF6N domain-containing protein [Betaproteobacteria bacterium]